MNDCHNCHADSAPHDYIFAGANKDKICVYCARRIGLAIGRRRDAGHESRCLNDNDRAETILTCLLVGSLIATIIGGYLWVNVN